MTDTNHILNYKRGEKLKMTVDGYNQTYDTGETSEAVIDLVVSIFSGLVAFGSLIALVLIYKWLKKGGMRLG